MPNRTNEADRRRHFIQLGTYKQERIASADRGENPTLVYRMHTGYVFMMDIQVLPGWCVFTRVPEVFELNSLPREERNEFLNEMHIVGEAISNVVKPVRMNYSILGNTDHFYTHTSIHGINGKNQNASPNRLGAT